MKWGAIEAEYRVGDRVRPSARFWQIFPMRGKRRGSTPIESGIIVGFSRDVNCYRIIWDGRKHYETIHGSFLEKVQSSANDEDKDNG